MLENITYPEYVDYEEYQLRFDVDSSGGFSFPCDEDGVVNVLKLPKRALENYILCQNGEYGKGYVETINRTRIERGQGRCVCGEVLTLDGDQQCKCGRMYNSAGQELRFMGYNDPDEPDHSEGEQIDCLGDELGSC